MSLFRQVALRHSIISGGKDVQHTLNTLRLKLFAKAGYVNRGQQECAKTCGRYASAGMVRRGLREQVRVSPLFDVPRFAKHFEGTLWGMWRGKGGI